MQDAVALKSVHLRAGSYVGLESLMRRMALLRVRLEARARGLALARLVAKQTRQRENQQRPRPAHKRLQDQQRRGGEEQPGQPARQRRQSKRPPTPQKLKGTGGGVTGAGEPAKEPYALEVPIWLRKSGWRVQRGTWQLWPVAQEL